MKIIEITVDIKPKKCIDCKFKFVDNDNDCIICTITDFHCNMDELEKHCPIREHNARLATAETLSFMHEKATRHAALDFARERGAKLDQSWNNGYMTIQLYGPPDNRQAEVYLSYEHSPSGGVEEDDTITHNFNYKMTELYDGQSNEELERLAAEAVEKAAEKERAKAMRQAFARAGADARRRADRKKFDKARKTIDDLSEKYGWK